MTFYRIATIALLIFLSSCLSPLKQIKDPAKPFEREGSTLLPPSGEGWRYIKQEPDNGYILHFSRQGFTPSHKISAFFLEFKKTVSFSNPEHFLNYIRQMKSSDIDPSRHKIIENKWNLDNRFGDYSVRYYTVLKDYDPYRMDPHEYTISKVYGYAIVHPYFKNVLIDILYTEQGKPAEVTPEFEKEALQFINGLHLKKKE